MGVIYHAFARTHQYRSITLHTKFQNGLTDPKIDMNDGFFDGEPKILKMGYMTGDPDHTQGRLSSRG